MVDLIGHMRRMKLLDEEDLKKAREWLRTHNLPQDDLLSALVGLGLVSPTMVRSGLQELSEMVEDERPPSEEEDLYLLGQLVRNRLISLDRLTRCLDHKRALEGTNRTVRIHEILIEDGAVGVSDLHKLLEPTGRQLLDCHHCGNLEIVRAHEGMATCPRCNSARDLHEESAVRHHSTRRRRSSHMGLPVVDLPEDDIDKIGPYQVLELLGKGAAGVVYRGLDPDSGAEVAIKFLSGNQDVGSHNRTHREARILATLDHPGIVRYHGLSQRGHAAFLILDYIPGRTLDKWLTEDHPSQNERVVLFRQVAEALAYAHARGILHRDIKPSNILVESDGTAKLTDFGLAKRVGLDGASNVTDTGQILGTPRFISPEQLQCEEASEASDQYALGVLFWELLTGRALYQGVSVGELFAQIQKTRPSAPSSTGRTIPQALDLICLKALERDPQSRFPSVAAMVEEIDRYQRGRPLRLAPEPRFHAQSGAARISLPLGHIRIGLLMLAAAVIGGLLVHCGR